MTTRTAEQEILSYYRDIKKKIESRTDLIIDYNLSSLHVNTHIKIINNMGKLLNLYINEREKFVDDRDLKELQKYWTLILKGMLVQCCLKNVDPRVKYPKRYRDPEEVNLSTVTLARSISYKIDVDDYLVYMENYLTQPITSYEPLWWIELGNKLKIVNLKIERDEY